jgi:hypothetical protein
MTRCAEGGERRGREAKGERTNGKGEEGFQREPLLIFKALKPEAFLIPAKLKTSFPQKRSIVIVTSINPIQSSKVDGLSNAGASSFYD